MEIEASASGSHGGGSRGAYLVWEDLSVVIPNFGDGPTKRLLNGLKGYAEPGRIMAIMGPSGSGKSTLLDALAGSLSSLYKLKIFVFLSNILCWWLWFVMRVLLWSLFFFLPFFVSAVKSFSFHLISVFGTE